jgi:hypothetical protein
MAATQIDDAQPTEAESNASVQVLTVVVRATMGNGIAHPLDHAGIHPSIRIG